MQRRAAAAAASRKQQGAGPGGPSPGSPGRATGTAAKKSSFADIQREQQQQSARERQQGQGQQVSVLQRQPQQQPPRGQQQVDEYGRLVRPSGGGGRGNARGGNRIQGSGGGGRSSLPIEQGVVHTLLDKFGFIFCADRERELFFHYSEYRGGHSDDLNIGDEVEFRVGRAEERGGRRGGGGGGSDDGEGEGKMSAFDVRVLPKGTVYWEKEDEPVGKRWTGAVEKVARDDSSRRGGGGDRGRSGGAASDGLIRIVPEDADAEAIEVHYSPSDYAPGAGGRPGRLDRNDVVEFTLVTERRTKKKFARKISLVRSERERLRLEREAKQLEDATIERGVVVSDRGDYGFLRSASRTEEVYYHVSNLVSEEGGDDGDGKAAPLNEGQEVEFYVINETETGGGRGGGSKKGGKSHTARKIKLLPRGSVKFEHTIGKGVTGIVTECPVESVSDPFGGGKSGRDDRRSGAPSGSGSPMMGKIRLQQPLSDSEGKPVTTVLLHPDMYPGGSFAISRTGSEVGTWIRPNDVLLFDVVQKVVDGSCHAVPTELVASAAGTGGDAKDSAATTSTKPAIRLVKPSLCGRAEGVVRSIHDNYGFITLAERSGVDVYFPLFEVLPGDIQRDLRRADGGEEGDASVPRQGGRVHVEVGMEVSFDLSLQILTNARGGAGGRYKQGGRAAPGQEKESLRARRIQILPKGTIQDKIPLASGVKATVTREDPKQPFVGTVELEEALKVETTNQRHPLVARLLDEIVGGKYDDNEDAGVVFHDVLSDKDEQIVISLVNARDDLEWRYVPENADSHTRKLCISKVKAGAETSESAAEPPALVEEATTESANTSGDDSKKEAVDESLDAPGEGVGSPAKQPDSPSKKKPKKAKAIKLVRFDKFSFADIGTFDPLGVGDVITCDVVQSRRSGSVTVENIAVVTRKERPPAAAVVSDGESNDMTQKTGLTGFVSEVVPSRQFGFISAIDEHGSKTGGHIFFHFKDIQSIGVEADDTKIAQDARSRKPGKGDLVKGDEVKFDAGPGKNGKITATNISILPRGTLKVPVKADKASSCTGYILMEPSHTSLANTPSHIVLQSAPASGGAGGRWANVKDDKPTANKSGSNVKEEGVILLLSDPSNLFSPKPRVGRPRATSCASEAPNDGAASRPRATSCVDEAPADVTGSEKEPSTDGASSESNNGIDTAEDTDAIPSAVGTHLRYKLSSMAARSDAAPKRGDLVTFGKTKGAKLVKDIRIEKMGAATSIRGTLVDINTENDAAVFVASDGDETKYDISLTEVVSCDKSLLKEKEQVDGILHEGKLFGGESLRSS